MSIIVLSAIFAGHFASGWLRLGLPILIAIIVPWLIRYRIRRLLKARYDERRKVGGPWFFVGWNLLLLAVFCLGFSDATGRALRRQGDWFVGESESLFARKTRSMVKKSAGWLERFDPPPEIAVAKNQPPKPPIKGVVPKDPIAAMTSHWFHPLSARKLPPNSSCRFGSHRPGSRPRECQLGHCGVDLGGPIGRPIYAINDGVVVRAVRDEVRGGIAGRFIILKHQQGAVRSYYIHLDQLSAHLRVGSTVKAGEQIGTLGRTGIKRSAPHLHFAVSVKRGGRYHYIDPEPLLWFWRIPKRIPKGSSALAHRH